MSETMTIKVILPFKDGVEKKERKVGDTFTVSRIRGREILRLGYAEIVPATKVPEKAAKPEAAEK